MWAALAVLFVEVATTGTTSPPTPVAGKLRVPQVAVNGTGLHARFLGWAESIDVARDQFDAELVKSSVSLNSTFTMQIELAATSPQTVVGLYDGHAAGPTLIPVFPGHAVEEWFSVLSFRTNPVRVIVNVFDYLATLSSSTSYPGANRNAIGFYVQGPNGTFYSQDARNPGGRPQGLYFRGTGLNTGQLWLALEDQSLQSGSDRDFDDAILFVENTVGSVVPVETTTWSRLKARFR
jgi:hypothetical protein